MACRNVRDNLSGPYSPLIEEKIPLCSFCYEVIVVPAYLSACEKHIFCLNCLLKELKTLPYSCPKCRKIGPIILRDQSLERRIELCAMKNQSLNYEYQKRLKENFPPAHFVSSQPCFTGKHRVTKRASKKSKCNS